MTKHEDHHELVEFYIQRWMEHRRNVELGEWEDHSNNENWLDKARPYTCSVCSESFGEINGIGANYWNFCPNCGAMLVDYELETTGNRETL